MDMSERIFFGGMVLAMILLIGLAFFSVANHYDSKLEHTLICKSQNMEVAIWGQRVNRSTTYHYFCVDNEGRVFLSKEK